MKSMPSATACSRRQGTLCATRRGLCYELRDGEAAVIGYDPTVSLGSTSVTPVIPSSADG